VCARWRQFEGFLADMGERPEGTTIERIDHNGNYEPGNCRWATRLEQMSNIRTNHSLTWKGRTQPITAWARETGLSKRAIAHRLSKGWSVERALGEPAGPTGARKNRRR
jgi:hypothetical protein